MAAERKNFRPSTIYSIPSNIAKILNEAEVTDVYFDIPKEVINWVNELKDDYINWSGRMFLVLAYCNPLTSLRLSQIFGKLSSEMNSSQVTTETIKILLHLQISLYLWFILLLLFALCLFGWGIFRIRYFEEGVSLICASIISTVVIGMFIFNSLVPLKVTKQHMFKKRHLKSYK